MRIYRPPPQGADYLETGTRINKINVDEEVDTEKCMIESQFYRYLMLELVLFCDDCKTKGKLSTACMY